jgi:hypothetical protein
VVDVEISQCLNDDARVTCALDDFVDLVISLNLVKPDLPIQCNHVSRDSLVEEWLSGMVAGYSEQFHHVLKNNRALDVDHCVS